MASIDFRDIDAKTRYKLLVGTVVPRPIAFVTSLSDDGVVNAAPFSFFNALCNDPPAVAVGVNDSAPGSEKDTARNIRTAGEFVVNLVDEALAPAMNLCEAEFGPDVSELDMAGLETAPSSRVSVPRIRDAPFAMECRLLEHVSLKPGRNIFIAEVLTMHLRDDLFDAEHNYVLAERAGLVARMHGPGTYARTSDLFDMPRLSPAEKQARFAVDGLARPNLGRGEKQ